MRYKIAGKSGLRVSELCLGTMTFGTEWGYGADYEESKKIFDAFVQAGGNFIDTANRYTEGTSEKFIGEFVMSDRDRFVIATKYTLWDRRDDVNASGNHRKNLVRSLEASLKRLQTEYIDILYVHAWDFTTGEHEMMRNLEDMIRSGKIHHIAISDTPAWITARCNTIAELRGWNSFIASQLEYSLLQRTPERDMIPMANAFNMVITAWAPLAGGTLTGKYLQDADKTGRVSEKSNRRNERNTLIATKTKEVADKLGRPTSQVALNWVRQQGIIPVIGSRVSNQITDSLGCLDFLLDESHIQLLNDISAIDLGFPHDFLASDGVKDVVFGGNRDKLIH